MWQVRDLRGAGWRDVTCDFYWDMGRLYVCWPGQPMPSMYHCASVRWHSFSPAESRRLRAFSEAA